VEEDRHVSWNRRHWFSPSVKLLGVTLDKDLTLDRHVTEIIRGCSYHTQALRHIRPLIDLATARMVAQGVVTSRLDYCNGLLYGTSTRNVIVCRSLRIHWLKPCVRLLGHQSPWTFIGCQFKAQSTGVPAYLASQ